MDAFEALADPTRRKVLDLLGEGERTVSDLVEALGDMSQPAVSRHLSVLLRAGLVRVRPEAQRRFYALAPDGFEEVERWLARHRRAWSSHLDALARHLDENPGLPRKPRERKGR